MISLSNQKDSWSNTFSKVAYDTPLSLRRRTTIQAQVSFLLSYPLVAFISCVNHHKLERLAEDLVRRHVPRFALHTGVSSDMRLPRSMVAHDVGELYCNNTYY